MRLRRRLILSLGCILLAVTTLFLTSLLFSADHGPIRNLLAIFPVYLLFALPAWLPVLPLVVALKDAEGWHGWVILAVGVLLGPAIALVLTAVAHPGGSPQAWAKSNFFLAASLALSTLTTLFYYVALKLDTRRARRASARR